MALEEAGQIGFKVFRMPGQAEILDGIGQTIIVYFQGVDFTLFPKGMKSHNMCHCLVHKFLAIHCKRQGLSQCGQGQGIGLDVIYQGVIIIEKDRPDAVHRRAPLMGD